MGGDTQNNNDDADAFCSNYKFENIDCNFEELDTKITVSEILYIVNKLKTGKAMGGDRLMNSYFIESIDIIAGHLCDLFNGVLNSGFYPDSWTECIIVPLFKKGDRDNVANYRGITLISCLTNILTGVLNNIGEMV